MYIDIRLQNFRSYTDDSFELSPNVNIIVGPNAIGKTNLLEALLVSSRGSSYRVRDIDLIQNNQDWARLESTTQDSKRILKIQKIGVDKVSKSYDINTNKTTRLNHNQILPTVLFEPNYLMLFIGSPELRRSFLDDILEQTIIGYKSLKIQYKRALNQRNHLLKSINPTKQNIFVWNIRLSEFGGRIFRERFKLVELLKQETNNIYAALSNNDKTIDLAYDTKLKINNYESDLLHKLESNISIDIERGFTAYGPHRDDLEVLVNGRTAKESASRGETRSILLALKINEAHILEQLKNIKPLLLFDDVFSELDGARRLALTKLIKEYQTFITTTDADIVVRHFTKTANIIALSKN